MNHFGHQVVAAATNGELEFRAGHRLNSWDGSKALFGGGIAGGENDGSLRAVPVAQPLRLVDVDDPSVLDDCHPLAQPLGFLHQMSGQKDGLAAIAHAAHEIPNGPARRWVKPRGEFVEEHYFRVVDER